MGDTHPQKLIGINRKVCVPAMPPPDEQADAEYPLILITGRQLEHWHTGSMTRRTTVLDAIEPVPVIYLTGRTWRIWESQRVMRLWRGRAAVRFAPMLVPMMRSSRVKCLSPSAITRPRQTCSPMRRWIHSARSRSSSSAPSNSKPPDLTCPRPSPRTYKSSPRKRGPWIE